MFPHLVWRECFHTLCGVSVSTRRWQRQEISKQIIGIAGRGARRFQTTERGGDSNTNNHWDSGGGWPLVGWLDRLVNLHQSPFTRSSRGWSHRRTTRRESKSVNFVRGRFLSGVAHVRVSCGFVCNAQQPTQTKQPTGSTYLPPIGEPKGFVPGK